jgi:hypothetical protein
MTVLKPFHLAIVDRLLAENIRHGVIALGELLLILEIKEGHDEIISAWRRACMKFNISPERVEDALRLQQAHIAAW